MPELVRKLCGARAATVTPAPPPPMLYRYWLRSMPLLVNSRLATWLCTLAEKWVRSLTHQAPEAPKPAMVWAGAVTTAVAVAARRPGRTRGPRRRPRPRQQEAAEAIAVR